MRLKLFFLLLLQVFFSLNAQAYTCPDNTDAIRATTIGTIHLNEVSLETTVFTDQQDVEFWIAKCVTQFFDKYVLIATVTPAVAGLSRNSLYSIIGIQDNTQSESLFYASENLFITNDEPQVFATNVDLGNGAISTFPDSLNLTEPFTFIFTCHSSLVDVLPCASINPTVIFEVDFSNVIFSHGFESN